MTEMKILRLVFFLLSFSLSLAAKPLEVDVTAHSAMVMNAESGAVLFEKDPQAICYPASLTKIATALFVLDRKDVDLQRLLTVSHESLRLKSSNSGGQCPSYWPRSAQPAGW